MACFLAKMGLTNKIWDVKTIREAARRAVRRVDPIWRPIGPCRGGQVVVVAIVYERVSKHKEGSLSFNVW